MNKFDKRTANKQEYLMVVLSQGDYLYCLNKNTLADKNSASNLWRKNMIRYIIVSISSGILFGIMDGLINANPMAQKLYKSFEPIARKTINVPAGIVIDLIYGFVMAGLFILINKSLPGKSGLLKGLSFALIIWFFRVVMQTASQWMMYNVPIEALLYTLVCGLFEMLVLGMFYGFTLKASA